MVIQHIWTFSSPYTGMENNFRIEQTNNLDTPYDFNSVMQYSKWVWKYKYSLSVFVLLVTRLFSSLSTAFSKNGQKTIVSNEDPNLIFGQATKMSQNDIARVNRLYGCGECSFSRRVYPWLLHR